MRYIQTFTVRGKMPFPVDMLRYDHCFPDSEQDSANIAASIGGHTRGNVQEIKLCRFVNCVGDQPTAERWMSFDWVVSAVHARKG